MKKKIGQQSLNFDKYFCNITTFLTNALMKEALSNIHKMFI